MIFIFEADIPKVLSGYGCTGLSTSNLDVGRIPLLEGGISKANQIFGLQDGRSTGDRFK